MFSKKIFCLQKILPRFIPKGTYVYVLIQDVQIQTLDKHFPVILLAIRQGSLDLKHREHDLHPHLIALYAVSTGFDIKSSLYTTYRFGPMVTFGLMDFYFFGPSVIFSSLRVSISLVLWIRSYVPVRN